MGCVIQSAAWCWELFPQILACWNIPGMHRSSHSICQPRNIHSICQTGSNPQQDQSSVKWILNKTWVVSTTAPASEWAETFPTCVAVWLYLMAQAKQSKLFHLDTESTYWQHQVTNLWNKENIFKRITTQQYYKDKSQSKSLMEILSSTLGKFTPWKHLCNYQHTPLYVHMT